MYGMIFEKPSTLETSASLQIFAKLFVAEAAHAIRFALPTPPAGQEFELSARGGIALDVNDLFNVAVMACAHCLRINQRITTRVLCFGIDRLRHELN